MKTIIFLFTTVLFFGCTKNEQPINPQQIPQDTIPDNDFPEEATFDLDASAVPKFVRFNYIEKDSIMKVSMFRSGIGHDYSDDFESCRSMKHYFMPRGTDWSAIKIYSPVDGTVISRFDEWAGSQLHIRSKEYPAFTFRIFHVKADPSIVVGSELTAGQAIGTHISNETMSDIAVAVKTPADGPKDHSSIEKGLRLISFFQVMTDSLFNTYGTGSRNNFIIDENSRNNDPIECNGEAFSSSGTLENWVTLP
ncbi:MAG TPA: hypothetical protein VM101_05405 [Flavitalea sp.]|nr:hypothetical protein [Flavitalea sp.]